MGKQTEALKLFDKAIEAYRILNDFVGDLIAGTRTLELYQLPKIKAVANVRGTEKNVSSSHGFIVIFVLFLMQILELIVVKY